MDQRERGGALEKEGRTLNLPCRLNLIIPLSAMVALEACDDDLTEVRNVREQQPGHAILLTPHAKRFDFFNHLGFLCISRSSGDILSNLLLSTGGLSSGTAVGLVLDHIPDRAEEWVVFPACHGCC